MGGSKRTETTTIGKKSSTMAAKIKWPLVLGRTTGKGRGGDDDVDALIPIEHIDGPFSPPQVEPKSTTAAVDAWAVEFIKKVRARRNVHHSGSASSEVIPSPAPTNYATRY
ncbi:hypothetical protein Cni_G01676 [Canna indica]|uniref:Uncharacterized protein n=1 Tax=Canna indica TaxID=4628 RepID=A0AAQ3JPX8_9LILI|nr:hypothetical protein Cni_G01676 [Canna indica]